jgi:hypothetical protein
MTCPKGHNKLLLVEYNYGDPYRYDGVSEIRCLTCKKRYGRWTGNVLRRDEKEPPYGKPQYVTANSEHYNA